MFTLRKPTEAQIVTYLIAQQQLPFSYREVGCTTGPPPQGYDSDRERVLLGHGEEIFRRAKLAIHQWKMFPREIATLYWPDRPIAEGTIVAVRFRAGPSWSLNPCRIVNTLDESNDDCARYGFAYGTLPDHLERGEERFAVEWQHDDDSVWYDLYAVSQPRHWLARLGYPYTRYQQARFRQLSGQAMQRAVAGVFPAAAVSRFVESSPGT